MNRQSKLVLVFSLLGIVLVSVYARARGEGITALIPYLVGPPLFLFVGVSVARNALRQLGPPTIATVFRMFACWTVIVLAYEMTLRGGEEVRAGAFAARVFLLAGGVTAPYAVAGLVRRIAPSR
jgi:hypothetical protein